MVKNDFFPKSKKCHFLPPKRCYIPSFSCTAQKVWPVEVEQRNKQTNKQTLGRIQTLPLQLLELWDFFYTFTRVEMFNFVQICTRARVLVFKNKNWKKYAYKNEYIHQEIGCKFRYINLKATYPPPPLES